MQKRIMNQIIDPYNYVKVELNTFMINPLPPNSLVKIEVVLMDNRCNLFETNFFSTECNRRSTLPSFESETRNLLSKTEFKEAKFLKLPVSDTMKSLQNFTMMFFVKTAQHQDHETLDRTQRKTSTLA